MESPSNFKHFQKKKNVIANVFPKLTTGSDLVRPPTKKHRVRTLIDGKHVKVSQTLVKSSRKPFDHIFPSLLGEMIRKIYPWLKFEIIGVFVDTWTADYKYPVPDCENFKFAIQIQLSEKQKTFSKFFIPFMEAPSNFKHFLKKENCHSQCISELNDRLGLR